LGQVTLRNRVDDKHCGLCNSDNVETVQEKFARRLTCKDCGTTYLLKEKIFETPKTGKFGNSPWGLDDFVSGLALIIDYAATKDNKCCAGWCGLDVGIDAFQVQWLQNGWLNPEYKNQQKWLRYALKQVQEHGRTFALLLRVDTSVDYFQKLVMNINPDMTSYNGPELEGVMRKVLWINGRIQYWQDGKPLPPHRRPPFASCVYIIAKKQDALESLEQVEHDNANPKSSP